MSLFTAQATNNSTDIQSNYTRLTLLPKLRPILGRLTRQEDATEMLQQLINVQLSVNIPFSHPNFPLLPQSLQQSPETVENHEAETSIFNFSMKRIVTCTNMPILLCQEIISYDRISVFNLPMFSSGDPSNPIPGSIQDSIAQMPGLQSPSELDEDYECRSCTQRGTHYNTYTTAIPMLQDSRKLSLTQQE
jgi:hypothetical protein